MVELDISRYIEYHHTVCLILNKMTVNELLKIPIFAPCNR